MLHRSSRWKSLPPPERAGPNCLRQLALVSACAAGDAERVRELLELGVDADGLLERVRHPHPTAPLKLALMHDNTECAKLLIAAAADVNVHSGPDLATPLHVSCTRGNLEGARALIDAGAVVGPIDVQGRSPLFMSCAACQPECVKFLLDAQADVDQEMAGSNPGATPLYAAASQGSLRCTSLLCEAGAQIDARTRVQGVTPMLAACAGGRLDVAMLLSSFGATRDCTFTQCVPDGSMAEAAAQASGNATLVRWLQESYYYLPLHHVQALTPERARALLRSGASPVAGCGGSTLGASRPTKGVTPAQLAATLPQSAAAQLVVRAAAPWSPHTRELWGARQRQRAVELLLLGHQLARHNLVRNTVAFADAWLECVMPHALSWEE